jgi:hypothetical protein
MIRRAMSRARFALSCGCLTYLLISLLVAPISSSSVV